MDVSTHLNSSKACSRISLFVKVHTKKLGAIKSLITEFTTILLNEFPVALDSLVFKGISFDKFDEIIGRFQFGVRIW